MKLRHIVSVASVLGVVLGFDLQHQAKANVADDLNTNYAKVVDNCGSQNDPGFLCSGNIIRFTYDSPNFHTWDASPGSLQRGASSFMFIRKDVNVKNLAPVGSGAGIIYYPQIQQPINKKNADISCVFSTDAWSDRRPDGGCGATTSYPNTSQRCQEQGITTAEGWYSHFTGGNLSGAEVFQNSCGFDMTNKYANPAGIFNEAIKAHNLVANTPSGLTEYGYSEILIKTWPVDVDKKITNPEKLPIQAFFYANASALTSAQNFQTDYYTTTGIIVPIVKLNISGGFPQNLQFTYDDSDQKINVATDLNKNYNNIASDCGSKNSPAFNCSGVLFRLTSYSDKYHTWDPDPTSIARNGSTFAYLRKDIQFTHLMSNRNSGFIYYPINKTPVELNQAKVSCVFPVVGWSNTRPYGGCGASTAYPKTSQECQQQGIYTAEDWSKHFTGAKLSGAEVFKNQCAFDVSSCGNNVAEAFNEANKAHNMVVNTPSGLTEYGSNEVVVKPPETDVSGNTINPSNLPLQAFFYVNTAGLKEAQAYQQDYFNTAEKIIPVVYMNISDISNVKFEYKTTDQLDLKKKVKSPNS